MGRLTAATERRVWPTGRAWRRAMAADMSVVLAANTVAPAARRAGNQVREATVPPALRMLSWPTATKMPAPRLRHRLTWARLNRTLAVGLRATTSPMTTAPAAIATVATGGATSKMATMNVQLAVARPPSSRLNRRRGQRSVTRQQVANTASTWGRGPGS